MNLLREILIAARPAELILSLKAQPISFADFTTPNPKVPDLYTFPAGLSVTDAKTIKDFQQNNKIPGNLSTIHAIAHIEYNAMKGYIDTVARFHGYIGDPVLKQEFTNDFIDIAAQEATHFLSLEGLLRANGREYGFMPAIDSIRKDIQRSTDSLVSRIAVIALIQEGKGLDAGPHLLNRIKDKAESEVFKRIVNEEQDHVKNGLKWFKLLVPEPNQKAVFQDAWRRFGEGSGKKTSNMNWKLREKLGFPKTWFEF